MKSIKKRVLTILTLVLAILIIVPSFAYSFFYFFNDSIDQSQIDQTIDSNKDASTNHSGIDDIKENHSGSSASQDIIYEIYFFPSTFYTEQYYQYLHRNDSGVTIEQEELPKIEDASPTITKNDDGSYSFEYNFVKGGGHYNVDRNHNYEEIFDAYIYNDKGLNDILPEDAFGYIDKESNVFTINPNKALYNAVARNNYSSQGDEAYYNLITDNGNTDDFYSYDDDGLYNVSAIYKSNISLKYDWRTYKQDNGVMNDGSYYDGIGAYHQSWNAHQNRGEYGGSGVKTENPSPSDFDDSEKWGNHWRFRGDRLGYWEGVDFNEGRFLPIKVEVTNSMTEEEFESLALNPMCDAGDKEGWYNFTFSGWGYFNENNEFSIERTTSLMENSISSADAFGLYDIMQNLASYVGNSEDNIREENGKTIYTLRFFPVFSNGKAYEDTDDVSLGLRDPVRLSVDEGEDIYFTYRKKDQPETSYNNIPINYAYINNISLKNNSSLRISGASIINHGSDWWEGQWHSLVSSDLGSKIVSRFGEGLYNFYFFNVSPNVIEKEFNIPRDTVINTFDNMLISNFENILNFPEHKYKNITILTDTSYYPNNNSDGTVPYICEVLPSPDNRPNDHAPREKTFYLIGIEKVLETKFITDLNVNEDIKDQADNLFDSSPSMQKVSNEVYLLKDTISESNFTTGRGVNEDHEIISDFNSSNIDDNLNTYLISENLINNDQIYLIRNIDFTNYSSLNEAIFQIKLYKEDDTTVKFLFNDPYSNNSKDEKIEFNNNSYNSIYIKDNNSSNNEGSLYIPASYYFTIEEQENTLQRYYKPRHTAYLGMYDFILYFNGTNYELYCNRHYNVLVKVFSKNPTHGSDGYADENTGGDLIYERQTFVGSYANESDLDKNGLTFTKTITDYLNTNNYQNGTYYIKDHVTGFSIFKIEKNGTNVVVSRVVESFRIRKNFYFYLDGPTQE